MDVLADPSVFDIEPDNNGDVVSLKDLPKRVRFYHAIIDSRCLKKGEGFGKLKRVFVIFVCSYDRLIGVGWCIRSGICVRRFRRWSMMMG